MRLRRVVIQASPRALAHLIGSSVAFDCLLEIPRFLVTVTQPAVRKRLLPIFLNGLQEIFLGLLVLLQPEQGSSHVVIVYRVVWLFVNRYFMVLDCHLVLLELIESGTIVAVVGRDTRIDFYCLLDVLGLLLHLVQFSQSPSLHVIKLAFLLNVETPVAALYQLLPFLQVGKRVALQ